MKQEHFEILLESMNSKFDLVLEGHAALDEKFTKRFNELDEKIDFNSFQIKVLNNKIDDVETRLSARLDNVEEKLDKVEKKLVEVEEKLVEVEEKLNAVAEDVAAHRVDTEAHHGLYRVKEM